jgi:hypothetical protein
MANGPVGAAPVDRRVAQQELGQPVTGPGEVFDHVPPGAAQIPHRLLARGWARRCGGCQHGAVEQGYERF